ncbi:MAG: CpXC domain-containing protein [Proteobacteria bacterium]|nr:CpXC domain-containing protein [Pseudomonadota bacterium]
MPTYQMRALECPLCGTTSERSVAVSIDAGRSQKTRQEIMQGRFQRFECNYCGHSYVADGPLIYIDFQNKHWVGVFPRQWEMSWWQWEHEPGAAFSSSMLETSPPVVRSWAPGFTIRAVFGLAALREKLLCCDAGIDDRALEVVKLDLLRSSPHTLFSLDGRPRLVDATADELVFHLVTSLDEWPQISDEPQRVPARVRIARQRLDEMTGSAWQPALSALSQGAYVDIGRLMICDDQPRASETLATAE